MISRAPLTDDPYAARVPQVFVRMRRPCRSSVMKPPRPAATCRHVCGPRASLPIIASHNCHKLRQLRKIEAALSFFPSVSAAFCLEYFYFVLADEFRFHHIVAARYRDL